MKSEKPFWKSKKFWYAVAGVGLAVAKGFGIVIPDEAVYAIISLVFAQGLADLGKNKPEPTFTAIEGLGKKDEGGKDEG